MVSAILTGASSWTLSHRIPGGRGTELLFAGVLHARHAWSPLGPGGRAGSPRTSPAQLGAWKPKTREINCQPLRFTALGGAGTEHRRAASPLSLVSDCARCAEARRPEMMLLPFGNSGMSCSCPEHVHSSRASCTRGRGTCIKEISVIFCIT